MRTFRRQLAHKKHVLKEKSDGKTRHYYVEGYIRRIIYLKIKNNKNNLTLRQVFDEVN